jgi:hypothetical protein
MYACTDPSSVALTYKLAKGYSVQACGLLKNDVHITHKNSVPTSHVKNPPFSVININT